MEKPFYGRTGLLTELGYITSEDTEESTHLEEVADILQPELKWTPTLLTLPQALLIYFLHSEDIDIANEEDEPGVDTSLANYLRLSCIVETLWKVLNITRNRERTVICRNTFRWYKLHQMELHQLQHEHKVEDGKLSWYVPSYDLVTFHNEKEVHRRRNISHRSVTLIGKDEKVNHYILRHKGCSNQHAAMYVSFVFAEQEKLEAYLQSCVQQGDKENSKMHNNNNANTTAAICLDKSKIQEIIKQAWYALICLEEHVEISFCRKDEQEIVNESVAKNISSSKFAELWSVELMIVDLASTNGTIVEGERLEPFVPFRLIEGDHISFVGSPLTYMVTNSAT